MKLSIFKTYQEPDLDIKPVCAKIAEAINGIAENEIDLDLSDCLIGYDSTYIVIDKIIEQMTALPGQKTLTIICDYKFPLDIIATLLFCGSRYVNDNTSTRKDSETIKQKMKDSLADSSIEINLIIDGQKNNYI